MITSNQLNNSIKKNIKKTLLKKHHHQNKKKFTNRIPLIRSFTNINKKHSNPHLLKKNNKINYNIQSFLTLL